MLRICLFFSIPEPGYAYKRYAYKKNVYEKENQVQKYKKKTKYI